MDTIAFDEDFQLSRFAIIKELADLADRMSPQSELLDDIAVLIAKATGHHVVNRNSTPTIEELITLRTNKLQAIKAHRERTGLGVKESKDVLERAGFKLGFLDEDGRYRDAG